MKNIDQDLLNRNRNFNRGYRKLVVWKEAMKLFVFVKKKLNTMKSISYKVKEQIEGSIKNGLMNMINGITLEKYINKFK
jgi:hypothetical protein